MKARLIRLVAFALPVLVFLLNFGLFQDPVNKVIQRDDRNGGISVRAHWRWYVDPTVLVYDLREMPAGATGIDALRPFLQFAYKQKDRQFSRVDLAWRGTTRFSIQGTDFAELGKQYAHRSPVDTMVVMPGSRASARRGAGVPRSRRLVRRAELAAAGRLHDVRERLDGAIAIARRSSGRRGPGGARATSGRSGARAANGPRLPSHSPSAVPHPYRIGGFSITS